MSNLRPMRITAPLTEEEILKLRSIKQYRGIQIGNFAAQAIREKLTRDGLLPREAGETPVGEPMREGA